MDGCVTIESIAFIYLFRGNIFFLFNEVNGVPVCQEEGGRLVLLQKKEHDDIFIWKMRTYFRCSCRRRRGATSHLLSRFAVHLPLAS